MLSKEKSRSLIVIMIVIILVIISLWFSRSWIELVHYQKLFSADRVEIVDLNSGKSFNTTIDELYKGEENYGLVVSDKFRADEELDKTKEYLLYFYKEKDVTHEVHICAVTNDISKEEFLEQHRHDGKNYVGDTLFCHIKFPSIFYDNLLEIVGEDS